MLYLDLFYCDGSQDYKSVVPVVNCRFRFCLSNKLLNITAEWFFIAAKHLGSHLRLTEALMAFLSLSRQIPGQYLIITYCFFSHPFQFVVYSYPNV
jgi:hypothetical protein